MLPLPLLLQLVLLGKLHFVQVVVAKAKQDQENGWSGQGKSNGMSGSSGFLL